MRTSPTLLGALLGGACCLGELPNSFLKRRLGIAPGETPQIARARSTSIFDQTDWVPVACLLVRPVRKLSVHETARVFRWSPRSTRRSLSSAMRSAPAPLRCSSRPRPSADRREAASRAGRVAQGTEPFGARSSGRVLEGVGKPRAGMLTECSHEKAQWARRWHYLVEVADAGSYVDASIDRGWVTVLWDRRALTSSLPRRC